MLLGCLLELRSVGFEDLAVVGELLLPNTFPAMVAEPSLDTAAASEWGVSVVPVVTAVVGGILLEAATITMKRPVAAGAFAVAELVTVFWVTGRAVVAHSAFTAAWELADAADSVTDMPAVALVFAATNAVFPTLIPFLHDLFLFDVGLRLLATVGGTFLMKPLTLPATEDDLVEQVIVLLRVRREFALFFHALTNVVGPQVLDKEVVLEFVQLRIARDTCSVVCTDLFVVPTVDFLLDPKDHGRVPVIFIGDIAGIHFLRFGRTIAL